MFISSYACIGTKRGGVCKRGDFLALEGDIVSGVEENTRSNKCSNSVETNQCFLCTFYFF